MTKPPRTPTAAPTATTSAVDTADAPKSARLRVLLRAPGAWHAASLIIGLIVILWLQRNQWFFLDEWAFLKVGGPGLFEPHVGHWSTSSIVLFQAMRNVFGLDSYWPFAVAVTLAHLATAHLVWRIALRARANPWIATAGTTVLVLLGSGAENILWGFQVGFLSGIALGLFAFVIADATSLSHRRLAAVIAVSIFALTWSGTAIPLVAATTALIVHRHGLVRALTYAAACGGIYASWYIAFAIGNPNNPDTGGLGWTKIFILIPRFLGVMLLLGWQSVFPVFGIGALALLGILVWLIWLWRSGTRVPGLAPALILTAAAAAFAFMTAYSRAEWSVGSGQSSRYLYVLVVLLLPLCAVALTRLAHDRRVWVMGASVLLVGLAAYQAAELSGAAQDQATTEQGSHRLMSAALSLYVANPTGVDLSAQPDGRWAPDVTLWDLAALYDQGKLPIGSFFPSDLATERAIVEPSP